MLTHCKTQDIETGRLLLRRFRYSDADDMLEHWISDPAIQSMYSEPVYTTKDEVMGLLDKYVGNYDGDDYYRWAIIKRSSNVCIGQIAFFLVDSKNHFGEIEYCIGAKFHRRGYATEAVRAIIAYGFERINFHKIQVSHKQNNPASRGVIAKCNFVHEGTLRDYFYMQGGYVNRLYYSLLRSEWTPDYKLPSK